MKKGDWVWMPHAGHFICGPRCQFHLTTYVGGYVVSTLGELPAMRFDDRGRMLTDQGWEHISGGCDYESMVFHAKQSGFECCPWVMSSPCEVDAAGYTDAGEATRGHMEMYDKWSKEGEQE